MRKVQRKTARKEYLTASAAFEVMDAKLYRHQGVHAQENCAANHKNWLRGAKGRVL